MLCLIRLRTTEKHSRFFFFCEWFFLLTPHFLFNIKPKHVAYIYLFGFYVCTCLWFLWCRVALLERFASFTKVYFIEWNLVYHANFYVLVIQQNSRKFKEIEINPLESPSVIFSSQNDFYAFPSSRTYPYSILWNDIILITFHTKYANFHLTTGI